VAQSRYNSDNVDSQKSKGSWAFCSNPTRSFQVDGVGDSSVNNLFNSKDNGNHSIAHIIMHCPFKFVLLLES
jgi:hypothetical protein